MRNFGLVLLLLFSFIFMSELHGMSAGGFGGDAVDLNGDNKVNLQDLAILAENWLWEGQSGIDCSASRTMILNKVYVGDMNEFANTEVWYSFTPVIGGFFDISTEADFYSAFSVFSECDGEPIFGGSYGVTETNLLLNADKTYNVYYIKIAHSNSSAAGFIMEISLSGEGDS